MPPAGGVRTSLVPQARQINQSVSFSPFSPGIPMTPAAQQPVRGWDFPVNVNANIRPRAYEPFGFPALKAFANVELVRLAIETRKDQIERLEWQIKPIGENKATEKHKPRIDELMKFWKKPDGVTHLPSFLRALLEDLLTLDAPAMEMRRTRGGKLIGLEYIPGETIVPMVDNTGRRPRDPSAIAYQQIIKGTVWTDLTIRDVLYLPRNIRPNHHYGFGPVEQIIVTINTIMRRQGAQLSHFTESNVPAGLLTAPEGWGLDKLQELQQWMDDKIAGNAAEQAKLVWGPFGTKYQTFKEAPVKDEFDEWLARIVAFAFSLPPTPFVRQMNKGTANEDQDRALEEGLEPIKLWVKRWIDDVIQTEQGSPDLEFAWLDEQSIDPKIQAEVDDKNLGNLTTTIDEVRHKRGEDPLPNGMGKVPLVKTTSGIMPLDLALKQAALDPGALVEPPVPTHEGGAQPQKPAKPDAKPTAAEKLAKASKAISPTRPKARRVSASIAKALKPILAKAADSVAAQVEKSLNKVAKAEDPSDTAASIAKDLDLSDLIGIGDAIEGDLTELVADSGGLALAQVGVKPTDELTNRVFDRAVDYAKDRAAELVSIDGDESLVTSTRNMIRDTISKGLEDNLGTDVIAENLQESYAFSPERAETIARTEVATANGEGKGAGWKEAQADGLVITKSWQVSSTDNTCEECEGNEAVGDIPLDEPFPSGDDFEPGHPGCECVTFAEATDPADTQTDEE